MATTAIYRSLLSNVTCSPSIPGILQNIPCVTFGSEHQWRDIRCCRAFPGSGNLGKFAIPFASSLWSLNLNNFHPATVSQVGWKFTGEERGRETKGSTSDGTDRRHRVGMFLPCVRCGRWLPRIKNERKKKKTHWRKARAGKKLRSQTVTVTLASAVHDSPLYVFRSPKARYIQNTTMNSIFHSCKVA